VRSRRGAALLLSATLLFGGALAACTEKTKPIGAPCFTLPPSLPAGPPQPSGAPLPDVTLTCFNGGAPTKLGALGTPMIVNLWAAYCDPCRTELPAIQRFADRAGDRVRVIGVVTADRHNWAKSFIEDKKLTMTMLEDPHRRLLTAVHRAALPVTLFITGRGDLAYVYNSTALDVDTVADLAQRYLGVTVPA
jgi:thiol-disulfide isomerase/thioredoxin